MTETDYGLCGIVTAMDGWASVGPDQGIKIDIFRYFFSNLTDIGSALSLILSSGRDTSCKEVVKTGVVYPGINDLISAGVPEANTPHFGVIVRNA